MNTYLNETLPYNNKMKENNYYQIITIIMKKNLIMKNKIYSTILINKMNKFYFIKISSIVKI